MTQHGEATCPMDALLRTLMGPWTTYILWLLEQQGPRRFNALRALIPGISAKMLTERLRHLEAAGLVHRDHRPTIPPAVTYSLTARGHELSDVLDRLATLAIGWDEQDRGTLKSA